MNNRFAFNASMLMHVVGLASAAAPLAYLWGLGHSGTLRGAGVVAWVGLPFLIGAGVTLWLRRSEWASWALASVALVNWMIVVGSLYYEHLVMRPDSQAGFLFVALPLFELLLTFVGVVLAAVVARTRSAAAPAAD